MTWNVFTDDDGKPLGLARRIEIAAKHVLLGRAKLAEWTGGRIVCIPDPMAEPRLEMPWIGTTVTSQSWALNTNGELVDTLNLSIVPVFDEERQVVEDTESSIKSVVHEIDRAVFGNYYLRVTYFGMVELVERIEDVATVTYEGLVQGADIIRQRMARDFLYSYTINAATGEPT